MSQTKAQLIDPVDGTIVNADINASAAIAGSKISPAFSANITTTGNAVIGGTTINTGQDKALSIFGTNGSELKLQATNFGGTAADGGAALTCTFGSLFITNNNANGDIHFQTKVSGQSTSEKMRLTEAGKLGIGTTSPTNTIHIKADAPAIRFEDNDANGSAVSIIEDNNGLLKLRNDTGNAGTGSGITFEVDASEIMRIDSSGRLLLGTTTEGVANASKFTIATSAHCGVTIRSGAAHDGQIAFSDGTSGDDEFRGQIRYNHTSNFLAIATDAVERMRIDSSGNVGIGTGSNAIQANLHVQAAVPVIRMKDSDNNSAVQFVGQDGSIRYDADNDNIAGDSHHAFKTDNVERVRIQAEGLTFNGDTAAANALDDYEEGTWTPALTSGFFSGETYTTQSGTYVKIGDQLTAWFYIRFNAMTTSGGEIRINSPFTMLTGSDHKGSGIVSYHNFSNASVSHTLAVYQKSSTDLKFYAGAGTLFSATAHTSQAGKYLIGFFTVRTA